MILMMGEQVGSESFNLYRRFQYKNNYLASYVTNYILRSVHHMHFSVLFLCVLIRIRILIIFLYIRVRTLQLLNLKKYYTSSQEEILSAFIYYGKELKSYV